MITCCIPCSDFFIFKNYAINFPQTNIFKDDNMHDDKYQVSGVVLTSFIFKF